MTDFNYKVNCYTYIGNSKLFLVASSYSIYTTAKQKSFCLLVCLFVCLFLPFVSGVPVNWPI